MTAWCVIVGFLELTYKDSMFFFFVWFYLIQKKKKQWKNYLRHWKKNKRRDWICLSLCKNPFFLCPWKWSLYSTNATTEILSTNLITGKQLKSMTLLLFLVQPHVISHMIDLIATWVFNIWTFETFLVLIILALEVFAHLA